MRLIITWKYQIELSHIFLAINETHFCIEPVSDSSDSLTSAIIGLEKLQDHHLGVIEYVQNTNCLSFSFNEQSDDKLCGASLKELLTHKKLDKIVNDHFYKILVNDTAFIGACELAVFRSIPLIRHKEEIRFKYANNKKPIIRMNDQNKLKIRVWEDNQHISFEWFGRNKAYFSQTRVNHKLQDSSLRLDLHTMGNPTESVDLYSLSYHNIMTHTNGFTNFNECDVLNKCAQIIKNGDIFYLMNLIDYPKIIESVSALKSLLIQLAQIERTYFQLIPMEYSDPPAMYYKHK